MTLQSLNNWQDDHIAQILDFGRDGRKAKGKRKGRKGVGGTGREKGEKKIGKQRGGREG